MATAAMLSLNVKSTGVTVTVPDNDTVCLMYYLCSVTMGIGLNILDDYLVDWRNHRKLSAKHKVVVYKTTVALKLSEFIGKIIFRDDEGKICKGELENEFCDLVIYTPDVTPTSVMLVMLPLFVFFFFWCPPPFAPYTTPPP